MCCIHVGDSIDAVNKVRVFGADGKQLGLVQWVDLITHEYGQQVLGDWEEVHMGTEKSPLTIRERKPQRNPDGTLKVQVDAYARIEIMPHPAMQ